MVYTKRAHRNKRSNLGRASVIFFMLTGALCPAVMADSFANSPVRSTSATLLESISEGAERSASFAALVASIAHSGGIVYVEFGYCAFGRVNGCLLPFIARSGDTRYLRIVVTPDTSRRSHDQLIALVAHEMQHAREILEHTEVADVSAMLLLAQKLGTPVAGPQGGFETTAARAIGDVVLNELSRNQRAAPRASEPAHRRP